MLSSYRNNISIVEGNDCSAWDMSLFPRIDPTNNYDKIPKLAVLLVTCKKARVSSLSCTYYTLQDAEVLNYQTTSNTLTFFSENLSKLSWSTDWFEASFDSFKFFLTRPFLQVSYLMVGCHTCRVSSNGIRASFFHSIECSCHSVWRTDDFGWVRCWRS